MKSQKNEGNLIINLTFNFALGVIDYVEQLQDEKRFVMANQLMKSGTSIGANVREAQNAESKLDFIHKMKIAAKEADETQYWLALCSHSEHYSPPENLQHHANSIMNVLSKIIATSKRKSPVQFFLSYFI